MTFRGRELSGEGSSCISPLIANDAYVRFDLLKVSTEVVSCSSKEEVLDG